MSGEDIRALIHNGGDMAVSGSINTLYDLTKHNDELFSVLNSKSQIAFGNYKTCDTVQTAMTDHQRKLQLAEFTTVQLNPNHLLAYKAGISHVSLELIFERALDYGTIINYSLLKPCA